MREATLLIVDDHPMLREAFRQTINQRRPEYKFVAEAGNGREAVAQVARHKPDLVLLDLSMPECSGLDVIEAILRQSPTTRILVLTSHDSWEKLQLALRAGAHGYVLKAECLGAILTAMQLVLQGLQPISPHMTHYLATHYLTLQPQSNETLLSQKERKVLELTAEGKTAGEIGKTLGIAKKTVDDYRGRLRRKLGCHDLAQYGQEQAVAS